MHLFIGKSLRSASSVISVLLTITALTTMYGNLIDRVTSNLFVGSSDIIQLLDELFGGLSILAGYLFGALILIGPMDYWISVSEGFDFNLILTILFFYLISSVSIGYIMRKSHPIGAFIMGIVTMAYFNYGVYTILYALSYIPQLGSALTIILNGIVGGIYGSDINFFFLLRGTLENGVIMGIFGAFWASIFMPTRNNMMMGAPNVIGYCPPNSSTCYVPVNKLNANKKPNIMK